ncbi:hypothetical protein ACFCV8_07355 [Streptomyces sp. NPDC056347]|uniref:hypothetical protein n=1 Tax=Streptomyces sp. NPDC056347 TaxID=3345790 RepID=UPI0035D6D902
MLRMYGFDGGTPTHRAYRAITEMEPEMQCLGGERLDLTVLPRWTEYRSPRPAREDAWYDLLWTDPADQVRAGEFDDGRGRAAEVLCEQAVARAGHLPMPPVIPVETRLAGAGPVTLDGMSEEEITLWGGREKALEMLRRRRRIAVEGDRTTDIYDWDEWARRAISVITDLTVPTGRLL